MSGVVDDSVVVALLPGEALQPLKAVDPERMCRSERVRVSGILASSNVLDTHKVAGYLASASEAVVHHGRTETVSAHDPGSSDSSVSGGEAAAGPAVQKSTSTFDCLSIAQEPMAFAAGPSQGALVGVTVAYFACW